MWRGARHTSDHLFDFGHRPLGTVGIIPGLRIYAMFVHITLSCEWTLHTHTQFADVTRVVRVFPPHFLDVVLGRGRTSRTSSNAWGGGTAFIGFLVMRHAPIDRIYVLRQLQYVVS